MAKVNIILYTSMTESDGQHPVYLRIYHNGARKHKSLVHYSTKDGKLIAHPSEWDFENHQYKYDKRNKILVRVLAAIDRYQIKLQANEKPFTISGLEKAVFGTPGSKVTFNSYTEKYMQLLKSQNRLGYARSFQDMLNAVDRFTNKQPVLLSEMDLEWIQNFEAFMSTSCGTNTRAIYHRNIRVIINRARREELIDHYPYGDKGFKIVTEATRKRAITKAEMLKIIEYSQPDNDPEPLPDGWQVDRDMFSISYLCRGANYMDIAQWRWDRNIINNRIEYIRQKTKRKKNQSALSIKIEGGIDLILSSYTRPEGYIFPVIINPSSESAKRHQIKNRLQDANANLKLIAAKVGVKDPESITFYVARHTYATVLKKNNVPIAMISELLGHEDEKTTQVYLASFDHSEKDDTHKYLV